MEKKFYICKHCGNMISYLENSGVSVVCCGEKMQEIIPSSVDASKEKHIPVVAREANKVIVTVGSIIHPMAEEHYIKWILIQTKYCCQRVELKPNQEPIAEFYLSNDDEVVTAFAYCNLHGLWKSNN